MKKSYVLFVTLALTLAFTVLGINILQNRSLKNELLRDKLFYIQAKNHLDFLEEYLLSFDTNLLDFDDTNNEEDNTNDENSVNYIKKIEIEDEFFNIIATRSSDFDGFFLSVSSKNFDIRVSKKLIIK